MHQLIQQRSQFFARIRQFFTEQQVLEVDTPLITAYGVSDPALHNICCDAHDYLITSPEYAMKHLLAEGSGDIYQLGHVFRGEEVGRKHAREFTLLEWYRLGFNHYQLMEEVVALVRHLIPKTRMWPVKHSPYRALLLENLGFDALALTTTQLAQVAEQRIEASADWGLDKDGYLDLLFTHFIEEKLGDKCLEFVLDYPPSQAVLAKIIAGEFDFAPDGGNPVAARFELYIDGVELCNGFWELQDPDLQRQRFIADNQVRQANALPIMPLDERLLQALEKGLPDCAGVALGVDRLLMLALAQDSIYDVMLT